MDYLHLAHVGADADFYDDAWHVPVDDVDHLGPSVVPEGVTRGDAGPWRSYRTQGALPSTGWKVHVSCVPDRAVDVVCAVVELALSHGLTCKHLRTRQLVASTQAKYADPNGAGKVVTVYPSNDVDLKHFVRILTDALSGEPGARVLSDIPVVGAPVSLRYGAFMGVHRLEADGQSGIGLIQPDGDSAPDDRSPHSSSRTQRDTPTFVRSLQETAARRDADAVLPVRDVRVIHRSNAGGVYAATWSDGTPVVLKEARRHTGFDLAGTDAVTRLRHERCALQRLAGTGVAPELKGYHHVGESEFLVMEFVEGASAATGMASGHPGAVPGADGTMYRHWVENVVEGTRAALEVAHSRGVAHLDVHPGNVVENNGRAVLIDFESCAIDSVAVARGVGTVLSTCGDDVSPEADLKALTRMRALLVNPQFSLTARRPDLAAELLDAGEKDLQTFAAPAGEPMSQPQGPDIARVLAGLHVAATPDRNDRLFPGDAAGLGVPGAGLGLLHGAGGVVGVLSAIGEPVPASWRTWLVDHAKQAPYLAPGLDDGAEGTALCLARIGETTTAREVMSRWGQRVSPAPWWAHGTAGQAVAHAELSLLLDDPGLMILALNLLEETLDALERDTPPPGYRAGLLRGWAGVGLALLRVAECLKANQSNSESDGGRLLNAARRAFDLEMAAVQVIAGAWMTKDSGRLMPYLGTGSASLGLLAHALLKAQPPHRADSYTDPLIAAVEGVAHALRLRAIGCSGLMHGRAGLLLALTCLAPGDPVADLHQHRLGWHTVPVTQTSRKDHPLASSSDLLLGDQNLRASADLASGSAGVLLAVNSHPPTAWSTMSTLLSFPRSGLDQGTHSVYLTAVPQTC